ncbi:MAG: Cysteine desulfurase IscS [Chlamydiae bacterium]|nr:Cysteine desulfurase IscS [Chlamydiota bacterium]
MDSEIYLDNAVLAKPSSHLINQMQPFLKRHWQSVTSPYLKGKEPFATINSTIRSLYNFVGAHEGDRFTFTASGAEAAAQLFASAYTDHLSESGKNHILIEKMPPFLEKLGCIKKEIPLNENGQLTRENLEAALSPRTGLLSIAWADAKTGVIHPIWEIAELCHERGVLLHVDGSAILGKLYFKLEDIPIDYLTFEGTLLHGPKGSGGLFVNRFTSFEPLISDAPLNAAALIGLGVAFEELSESFDHLCMETPRLRDILETGIQSALPETAILYHSAERLPHITAINFPGIRSELLAFHLREAGVFVSFGESSSLTFTLSRDTTEEEIRRALSLIVDAAQRCRTFSERISL